SGPGRGTRRRSLRLTSQERMHLEMAGRQPVRPGTPSTVRHATWRGTSRQSRLRLQESSPDDIPITPSPVSWNTTRRRGAPPMVFRAIYEKIKQGLSKTRDVFSGVASLFRLKGRVDKDFLAELEKR